MKKNKKEAIDSLNEIVNSLVKYIENTEEKLVIERVENEKDFTNKFNSP